jgi:hypothetical protein
MICTLVNTTDYTPFSLITFGAGCVGWLVVYVWVVRDMVKTKTLEIPIAAVCSNFGWEIYWGLVHKTEMGTVFQWAYFLWFFFDIPIVFLALKYGRKQMISAFSQKYYYQLVGATFLFWMLFYYFFIPEYDDGFGALTGFLITIYMGALFFYQKVQQPFAFGNNKYIAWLKWISTGLCTFACFQRYPTHHTLHFLCIAFFIIDAAFIYLVYNTKKIFGEPKV